MDKVTRRLERVRERAFARQPQDDADRRRALRRPEPAPDLSEIAETAAALVEQRVSATERNTAKALDNIAELIEKNQRVLEASRLEETLEAYERRTEANERKTAQAIENIAELIETRDSSPALDDLSALTERLERIESKLSQQPALTATSRPIRNALARLESQIQDLSNQDRSTAFEQALTGLDQRLDDLASRLERDARSRRGKKDESAPKQMSPEPERKGDPQERPAQPSSKRPLAEAVAAITQRQRTLSGMDGLTDARAVTYASPTAPASGLDWLTAPDGAKTPRPKLAAEAGFDAVRSPVETQERRVETTEANDSLRPAEHAQISRNVEGLRRELDDLAHIIGDLAPRASVDAIAVALRELTERIGAQRDRGVTDQALALAEHVGGEIRSALTDLDPSPVLRQLHADLGAIAGRLDDLREPNGLDSGELSDLFRNTSEIKDTLRALASRPLPLEKLETRLFDLTQRVEKLSFGAFTGSSAKGMRETAEAIREIVAAETGRGFEAFNQKLERVTSKIDETLAKSGGKRFDELGTRIDSMHKSLAQRIDRAAAAQAPDNSAALESLVASLAKKIDTALDPKSQNNPFDELGRKIEKLESRLRDPAAADSMARIELLLSQPSDKKQFAEIAERLDNLGKTLAARFEQGALAEKGVNLAPIDDVARKLGDRIDAALSKGAGSKDFDQILQQIEVLSHKLDRVAERPPLDRAADAAAQFEAKEQFHNLSDRIEHMHSVLMERIDEGARQILNQPSDKKQFAEIAERLDNLGKTLAARFEQGALAEKGVNLAPIDDVARKLGDRIDAALSKGAGSNDLDQILQQIEVLSRKLDRVAERPSFDRAADPAAQFEAKEQFRNLSDRIEHMHSALMERIDEGARRIPDPGTSQVAEMVAQLARKMDAALAPNAGGDALASLEKQIKALSARLDRTESSAIVSIERKITALFDRFDEIRGRSAEEAQEAVREAAIKVLAETPVANAPVNPAIESELEAIRRTHDESGARTHETLSVVHETLERVVDRLAAFEEELTEIRTAPTSKTVSAPEPDRDAPTVATPERVKMSQTAPAPQASPTPQGMRGGRVAEDLDVATLNVYNRKQKASDSVSTDFIAAARRAAQQAAADADAAETERYTRRAAARKAAGMSERVSGPAADESAQDRKRPILLALAAILVAGLVGGGAYQLVRFQPLAGGGTQSAPSGAPAAALAPKNTSDTGKLSARQESASSKPPAPPPTAPANPAPNLSGAEPVAGAATAKLPPSLGGLPIDNTPIGSIGAGARGSQDFSAVKSAATRGEATAQYELGARLAEGRGVARDAKAAAQWFEKAAMQGSAPAQYRLGSLYEKGVGVDRDYAKARNWYQQAAEAGNAKAMHNLAVLFAEGSEGKPDYGAASDWFHRAAEYGVRDSQFNLAILYARGLGVGQSLIQSYMWFATAANQGDQDAAKKRDEVGARLDSKDLATAKALVDSFKPRSLDRDANEIDSPKNGWQTFGAPETSPPTKPPAAGGKSKVSGI